MSTLFRISRDPWLRHIFLATKAQKNTTHQQLAVVSSGMANAIPRTSSSIVGGRRKTSPPFWKTVSFE
jgi:hypothetical protein